MIHETFPTATGRSRIAPTIRALYSSAAQAYMDLTQRALPPQLLLHHDALLSELTSAFGASVRYTATLSEEHHEEIPIFSDVPFPDHALASDSDDTVYSAFSFDDCVSNASGDSGATEYSSFPRAAITLPGAFDPSDPSTWDDSHFELADAAERELAELYGTDDDSDDSSEEDLGDTAFPIATAFTLDDLGFPPAGNRWTERCQARRAAYTP